ncbi:MAG: hypothetical protein KA230_11345 [Flavobacteriales bacterium]|nr:hypothetical protein [Flavobacteriales bacterium]
MRLSTIIIALFVCAIAPVHAQQSAPAAPAPHTWYFASGGEWILSYALLDVKGDDKGSIPRFSPFFNLQRVANYDVNEHFGFFVGLSLRNVGFIYDVPDTTLRYKFRTYTLGLPIGFKVGTMGKGLLFVGYELELPFNYKEKRFENEKKEDKFNVWFSDRNEPLFHTVMLGYQLPKGTCIKFKYYITNFHNEDFTENRNGVEYKPYNGFRSNILYVSLGFKLFQKENYNLTPPAERDKEASLY